MQYVTRPARLAKPQLHSMTGMAGKSPGIPAALSARSACEGFVVKDADDDDLSELRQVPHGAGATAGLLDGRSDELRADVAFRKLRPVHDSPSKELAPLSRDYRAANLN